MIMAPSYNPHSNQCVDPEEFLDFSAYQSPPPATLKREASATSSMTSPSTTIDDDLQTPAKPSHEYERFKQQTGLPSGSIAGLNAAYNSGFSFSSTGIDEMAMMGDASMMDAGCWNTGLPIESNINMGGMDFQQPNYLFTDNAQDDFVDPSAIEEAPQAVRVWPGMHQQLAQAQAKAQAQQQQQARQLAMQKQAQASQQQQLQQQQQQQQQQLQQQQQQSRAQPAQAGRKTSSPLSDARTEETIARVVAQIRADSQNSASSMGDGRQDLLPHIIRAKKDEEDMDEDERLLASEEGKKLSSKERRQLRNKVSARAFRSRRKGQYHHTPLSERY
jgi:chemotaxis protein histidine kinase CheA